MAEQPNTKERILDAAEALFAENGYAHASMRAITGMAGVNLAAVNYHFGSKDGLVKAVFTRRLTPVNDERLRRLDELERTGDPSLEALLEAFIQPALELSQSSGQGGGFVKLMGRAYTEYDQDLQDHIYELNREVVGRFKQAFQKALPHLPREELSWRLRFLFGAVAYTMVRPQTSDPEDARALMARLTPFLAAGLRAPLPASVSERAHTHAG